uniref:Medium-chain acyl-CoA ligase ACSF2, mitochondrial n=1 Tax=Cyprinus carpio TaxID=7962 RepID=A0A8C2DPY0_CYPCA
MLSNRKRPSSWVSKVRNSAADIPYFTFSYHKHRFQDVHKTHFNTYILLYTQTLLFALLIFSAVHVNNPPSIPTLTTSYVHGTSSHSLLSSTVDQCLQRSVERHPDREALVFMQDRIRKTFAQFYQDVSVNPAYQLQEVEFALRKVQCNAVVCPTQFKTQRYGDMLRQLCPEMETASPGGINSSRLPDLHTVIVTDSQQPGAFHLKDVMQAGSSQHYQQLQDLQKKLSFDDPINILFTSGTTGKPKGATLSHHNIVNNVYFFGLRIGFNWKVGTKNVRICLPVPLYHCFGSVGGGMVMAVHGSTVVFPSTGYDGHANLVAVEKEKCTFLYGTPTMLIDMLSQPDLAQIDFSSLEGGIVAGSSCPPEVIRKVISATGAKEMLIGYGTTENSPVTFCGFPFDSMERKTETAGCICSHTEHTERLFLGYCVMLEYWKDDEKSQESITKDRWYKTGDIASLDGYGYCKIEGRIKDLIIRGGENIYPAEIEQFLHTHPKIQEAQVLGVKDERMGEEVCACIRLKTGQECTAEEIKAYCKGKIAHYKVPRYVTFVQGYPLTVSGKIQKYKLREQTEKLLGL